MTHICISKLTIIGSDNGLAPGRRQAFIWTNAGILLIGPLAPKFNEISNQNSYIWVQENPFENAVWKMTAIFSRPPCVKPQWVKVVADSLMGVPMHEVLLDRQLSADTWKKDLGNEMYELFWLFSKSDSDKENNFGDYKNEFRIYQLIQWLSDNNWIHVFHGFYCCYLFEFKTFTFFVFMRVREKQDMIMYLGITCLIHASVCGDLWFTDQWGLILTHLLLPSA